METTEIFSQLASHMVKGLMVHEQLANYYDFLSLDGYRREHEKQFIEESKHYRELCHFYASHYNKLITMSQVEDPKLIPESWFKYTRFDVDSNTKKNGVENGFKEWKNWELKTLELLQNSYRELFNLNEIAACLYIRKMIDEVESELQNVYSAIFQLESTGYDLVYISEMQNSK